MLPIFCIGNSFTEPLPFSNWQLFNPQTVHYGRVESAIIDKRQFTLLVEMGSLKTSNCSKRRIANLHDSAEIFKLTAKSVACTSFLFADKSLPSAPAFQVEQGRQSY